MKSIEIFLNLTKTRTNFLLKFFFAILLFIGSDVFAQSPITTDSRIRTLVYNPNEVYELKFYYNYQSFIEFSEDEEIEMISIGEAFAWRLTPAGKRLFVRPLEIAAHTNMTIITNKRTYHFDIRSDEFTGKADEDLVYTVRFFYPQSNQPLPIPPQLVSPNIANIPPVAPIAKLPPQQPILVPLPAPQQQAINSSIVKTPMPGADVDKDLPGILQRNPDKLQLNFDYSLSGKSDNIVPVKVYDDGNETYFQFANDNLVIPSINSVSSNGVETPLNYAIRDGYVTVKNISRQFTLRLADSLICIYNSKLILQKK
jgi:type IV secretion system protein VirB9